ncbi:MULTISPECIES: iron chelate uptake ABC transporter family permease subunit [unclassified Streptomyces]|uniref:FecCD family ABC transporter permease n=1 Tax=unclassified Streptomyces TaxID=2593676 RepID=UPI001BEBCD13|nr:MULTISPECIES: iron chelate uptake ABC transporter family permease subunit [unclassified Streptomyces]MBT2403126.1 iron chelate uptake ABC transporter family permease subunit [Streptomyces sp. ISL-21]MBT2457570.1 iron chelate uptake ABC transporter family permease subunit [Streptomyces sp. ISL-86]MBT2610197.1 iron chelate uptake ABC transporter family permease subunit [Streptomyces sp. ISL-87]
MSLLRMEAGPLGVAVRPRVAIAVLALALTGFAALVVSVSLGTYAIPLDEVLGAVLGTGDGAADLIIHQLRLPRALTALLVGAAFGLAGAVYQAVTRNSLASPDLIGIAAGSGAGAVTAILIGGVTAAGAGTFGAVPFGALAGALLTSAAIYLLAYRDGTVTGYRFVLVGLAANGALMALTRWMLARADIDQASRAMVWLTGSLNGRGYEHVQWSGLALALLMPLTLALARPYQLLQFDDDTARSLGIPLKHSRIALLVLATCLTALATSAAGPIAFIALGAPQIARRLTGTAGIPLVTSALTGSVLLILADLASRLVLAPTELPVGVLTGAVGAPYLLLLLARANRAGKGG